MASYLYRPYRLGHCRAHGGRRRVLPALNRYGLGICLTLLLAGCAEFDYRHSRRSAGYGGEPPAVYRVSRGDTLSSIAWRYGLNYQRIARWNGIGRPYTIYPGQRLTLRPGEDAPVTGDDRTATARAPSSSSSSSSSSAAQERAAETAPAPKPAALDWRWPVDGPILSEFHGGGAGRQGIAIGGEPGDPVRAAGSGRVVYSGNGLRGYGRLVIVKHRSAYLTAYAYNERLLVSEGDSVSTGDVLARLGHIPDGRAGVHFELRRNGKPVNPMEYLPSR